MRCHMAILFYSHGTLNARAMTGAAPIDQGAFSASGASTSEDFGARGPVDAAERSFERTDRRDRQLSRLGDACSVLDRLRGCSDGPPKSSIGILLKAIRRGPGSRRGRPAGPRSGPPPCEHAGSDGRALGSPAPGPPDRRSLKRLRATRDCPPRCLSQASATGRSRASGTSPDRRPAQLRLLDGLREPSLQHRLRRFSIRFFDQQLERGMAGID